MKMKSRGYPGAAAGISPFFSGKNGSGSAIDTGTVRIKGRIECIEVLAVQIILDNPERFAESLIMDNFPLSQITDDVADIRVFDQPENVVVSDPRFLFWCNHIRTTCD